MEKLQILLIKFIALSFQIIPESLSYFIGKQLGLFWFYIIRYRRNLVIENIKQAYGNEKTPAEISKLAKDNFIHYGISLAEFLRLPKLTLKDLENKIHFYGKEILDNALKKNKGAIILCGHYGNWDMLSISQAMKGYNAHIITRRAKNRSVDEFWQKIRENKGVKFLEDRNSIFDIIRLIKQNKVIGMIFDQHVAGRHGIKVNFFNRPAWTMKAVALLALKYKVPVIPTYCYRDKNQVHHAIIEEELPLKLLDDQEEAIKQNTQAYNNKIEEFVRKNPEQWLWIHRRWK